jgi:calcineurin-like phosphoesterase family protein
MDYFVISDTHFGHSKMLEYEARPKNYEILLMSNCLRTLTRDHILIHLGDICIGEDQKWNEFFLNLPCKTILVRGNHDHKSLTFYNKYWDHVCDKMDINVYGKYLVFTHRPVEIQEDQTNIHGHCHTANRENEILNDNKHILVKVEHEYKPFRLRSLLKC